MSPKFTQLATDGLELSDKSESGEKKEEEEEEGALNENFPSTSRFLMPLARTRTLHTSSSDDTRVADFTTKPIKLGNEFEILFKTKSLHIRLCYSKW